MERQLVQRVYNQILDGTLTPEVAYNAWLEKHSYDKLFKRLETKVKLGIDLASRLTLD